MPCVWMLSVIQSLRSVRQHSCALGQAQAERSVGRAQWAQLAVLWAETLLTESHAGEKRLASAFPRCWRPTGVGGWTVSQTALCFLCLLRFGWQITHVVILLSFDSVSNLKVKWLVATRSSSSLIFHFIFPSVSTLLVTFSALNCRQLPVEIWLPCRKWLKEKHFPCQDRSVDVVPFYIHACFFNLEATNTDTVYLNMKVQVACVYISVIVRK